MSSHKSEKIFGFVLILAALLIMLFGGCSMIESEPEHDIVRGKWESTMYDDAKVGFFITNAGHNDRSRIQGIGQVIVKGDTSVVNVTGWYDGETIGVYLEPAGSDERHEFVAAMADNEWLGLLRYGQGERSMVLRPVRYLFYER